MSFFQSSHIHRLSPPQGCRLPLPDFRWDHIYSLLYSISLDILFWSHIPEIFSPVLPFHFCHTHILLCCNIFHHFSAVTVSSSQQAIRKGCIYILSPNVLHRYLHCYILLRLF